MRELWQLAWIFLPLSLLSFGGGASIIAPMHDAAVDHYKWLTSREFIDCFAISRMSPGPSSMLVALVGWKVAGWAGAIVATIAMFVPSSIVCYRCARVWDRHRGSKLHTALEQGLLPIGMGLTMSGAVLILRASESGVLGWAIAAGATVLLLWRNLYPLVVLAIGGSLFVLLAPLVG